MSLQFDNKISLGHIISIGTLLVAGAAGLTDQALDTVMESVGLSLRAEAQPVEPGPVIGERE